MTYKSSFAVGDRVEKFKGAYTATGTVIGVGKTRAGAVRYMVEYDVIKGMIHIHSDNDLRRPIVDLEIDDQRIERIVAELPTEVRTAGYIDEPGVTVSGVPVINRRLA